MAVVAHEPHHPNQTHHEVTRDVVNTLGTADRGYFTPLQAPTAMKGAQW